MARPPQHLDEMVEHIRYEVVKLINFATTGNGWIFAVGLPQDWATFASECILEAGAVHLRNVVEFLQDPPKGKRVSAREYVPGWKLEPEQRMSGADYGQLHARVSHLSTDRTSVATDGAFEWSGYLQRNAPLVLSAFRRFLLALPAERREQFHQPRPDIAPLDLVAAIDNVLQPSGT